MRVFAVLAFCVVVLAFCTTPGRMLVAVSTSKGPCGGLHPLHAYMCGGSSPKPVITASIANDLINGECLLSLSIGYGRADIFTELIKNGANPKLCLVTGAKVTDRNLYEAWASGIQCTYTGAREKTRKIYSALDSIADTSEDVQRLFSTAANRPCPPVLEMLLDHDSELNLPYSDGDLPLVKAFGQNFRKKIDVNSLGENGYTPLMSVLRRGLTDDGLDSAALLLRYGADIDKPYGKESSVPLREWLKTAFSDTANYPKLQAIIAASDALKSSDSRTNILREPNDSRK